MEPSSFTPATVFLDANVLYPAGLRDLLMRLSLGGLLRARWSNPVHEEWMEAVLRDFPNITRSQVERIRDLMNSHAADSLVTGFERWIKHLMLPDPDDRHVLAAAIHCHATVILTLNLKDFPEAVLINHGIAAQAPDQFIHSLLVSHPEAVVAVIRQHRAALLNPHRTVAEYLAALELQGLSETVVALHDYAQQL